MVNSLKTAHGNIVVALDIETTGELVDEHEMYQLVIVPLNSMLERDKTKHILDIYIKPETSEFRGRSNSGKRERFIKARNSGLNKVIALDIFEAWVDSLNIRKPGVIGDKQIMVITHNWGWKRAFLLEFLGQELFYEVFHWHIRDIICAGAFCNDRAEFRSDPQHFGKLTLASLSSTLKVKNLVPDDPVFDCLQFAEIYKKMVEHYLGEFS